jgi:phospholipase A1
MPKRRLLWLLLSGASAHAETVQECLALAVQSAAEEVTVAELRTYCDEKLRLEAQLKAQQREREPASASTPALSEEPLAAETAIETEAVAEASGAAGALSQRLALERYARDNPFVLTPHRANYVMPLVYLKDPNEDPFADRSDDFSLQSLEFQFQLSLKAVVWNNILGDRSHLTFAYTNRSFWQAYNGAISAPFRETNHEPEALLTFENDWNILGFRNVANQFIVNHQSNGRAGSQSRSWNRLMANFIFERDNLVMSLKPWYRLPEESGSDPNDPSDDDNPDIEHYMGHFEWFFTWQRQQNIYSVLLRNNLHADNKGAVELGWSFPIGGRFKGYIKYFNGYGESLIDYNDSTESVGIGVLISDWL